MKIIMYLFLIILCVHEAFAQQTYYDVTVGAGNGVRFWQDNAYKIHMGNTAEYHYGPVTDYSIKTNMEGVAGRGWTWGANGLTPIAGLSNTGNLQIAGTFTTNSGIGIGTTSPLTKLQVENNSAQTDLSQAGYSDVGFYARNTNNASNNMSVISFGDAGGYGIGGIGVRIKSHINHTAGLFFYTRLNGGTIAEKMVIDENGSVGIGTTTPTQKLDVNGVINATGLYINGVPFAGGGGSQWTTASSNIYFNTSGNVGIGNVTPAYKLDVTGSVNVTGSLINRGSDLYLGNGDGRGQGSNLNNRAITHTDWGIGSDNLILNYAGDFEGGVNIQGPRVVMDGVVGIGTTSTGSFKLAVEGKIGAREINVLAGSWPDYVFEESHKLPSLEELNAYIKVNKHLPEVPSACMIEENGVNLGEMNMLLLKKVEELTLYILNQNKELQTQKTDLTEMRTELQLLKNKLK